MIYRVSNVTIEANGRVIRVKPLHDEPFFKLRQVCSGEKRAVSCHSSESSFHCLDVDTNSDGTCSLELNTESSVLIR